MCERKDRKQDFLNSIMSAMPDTAAMEQEKDVVGAAERVAGDVLPETVADSESVTINDLSCILNS